jgi:hypothetical protein
MSNGAKVNFTSDNGGVVHLGFGRGNIRFEIDQDTGKTKFWNPNESASPQVSNLLIQRAKAIYKKQKEDA